MNLPHHCTKNYLEFSHNVPLPWNTIASIIMLDAGCITEVKTKKSFVLITVNAFIEFTQGKN